MRRRWVVCFALLASLLAVTAMPAAAAHGLVVVSQHTTDTDFNNADTLENVTVSGSGAGATVSLISAISYNPVDDEGDGTTESNSLFVGDDGGNDPAKTEIQIQPDFDGSIDTLVANISDTSGADYGFVVDIYIVEGEVNQSYGDGQLVADDWDPTFSTGLQTIPLDSAYSVNAGTNYTVEFVTQSVDADSSQDSLILALDNSASANWISNNFGAFSFYGDLSVEDIGGEQGTYISQNHTAEQTEQGFVNITEITNATATVTWETNGGAGWSTLNQTSGITAAANHTFTWPVETNDTVRVNVTVFNQTGNGEPSFTLADEGVQFTASQSTIDNASASPDGTVSTTSPTLSIDVNDTDFGLTQSDSVAVEFFVDGNSEGTDTLTANGTAQQTVTLTGGDHTWSVEANDSYGHSLASATFDANVPANLTIRNETGPHGIISGCTANVRFYETTDDNPLISETTDADGDGNVSLVGLPVGTEFVTSIKCDGYYNRTILIEDIFSQSNAFLLHKSKDGDLIRFEIDDRTGLFAEEGEFIIERAINESEYNSSASGFRWIRIAGDEIGATDSFTITLEHETRYRLRIQNDQGDNRILKTYIPQGDGTEQIVVGRVEWPSTPGNATVFNASIEQESTLGNTPPVIAIQFVNPANLSEDPDKAVSNFNYSVFEAGNASNQIDSGTASGDLGTFYAETNLTESQANQKWIIQVQYDVDGETITERRVVGGSSVDIQADQDWLGLFALIGITSIGLLYGQRTANLGIALMWIAAGVAMMFELIMINEAWYVVSGFIVAGALIRSNLR